MTRPSWDTYFLSLAAQAAQRSTCSRLQVGAVLVQERQVVGTGYNGAPKGMSHCVHNDDSPCRISVHAEANALLHNTQPLFHSELYVTHAPCYECSKLIINAKVWEVKYSLPYRETAGLTLMVKAGILVEWVPNTEEGK